MIVSGSRRRHPVVALALLGAVLASYLLVGLASAPATAAGGDPSPGPVPLPVPGHPWFGAALEGRQDLPVNYADQLGADVALYSVPVSYPLDRDATSYLEEFARNAATQGAVLDVDLQPQVPLAELTAGDATRLADELNTLHRELDTYFLLRFAPEMNGSWVTWGQQPQAYRTAFQVVAAAVHATTHHVSMVWAPAYGSGYPFGRSYGAVDPSGALEADQLDTTGDGVVTAADDPYGPYYPGDSAVDWVGLSLYRVGQEQGVRDNAVPEDGEYAARLAETWGYGKRGHRVPFYQRFAAARQQPMLVETSALYNPAVRGASELDLKRTWWRQVFAANADHPLIGAISWLEVDRVEPEVDDQPVDWRATHTHRLAAALRADLGTGGLDLGPVTRVLDQETANTATAQVREPPAAQLPSSTGWLVFGVVLFAVVFLLSGLIGRLVPSWRYPETGGPRDLRVDLVRGWMILAVVVTHVELSGFYSYVTLNAVSAVSGAEMFVLLSGVVLGMVHEPLIRSIGEWPAAVVQLRRARKLYLVALVFVVLVFLIGLLPGLDATVVTTFTDRGTGLNGAAVRGQVYDLYVNAPRLLDYPTPWYAVKELLLISMGPWVLNILGLFVVLTLLLPAFAWLLHRGLWWVLLAISWVAYTYGTLSEPHWLPSQFEDVFPLLIWQIAFVHGMVIGHYRRRLIRALTTRVGKVCCAILIVAYALVLGWLWLAHHQGFSPAPFPGGSYEWLYRHLYVRVELQPGRLVDLLLVLVVAFAFLTTAWKPVNAVFGRLLIPLGQASLYVFIMHVFIVIAVANIPGLDRTSAWQGAVIHTAAIAVLWLMVRRRFLFSVIPH